MKIRAKSVQFHLRLAHRSLSDVRTEHSDSQCNVTQISREKTIIGLWDGYFTVILEMICLMLYT